MGLRMEPPWAPSRLKLTLASAEPHGALGSSRVGLLIPLQWSMDVEKSNLDLPGSDLHISFDLNHLEIYTST